MSTPRVTVAVQSPLPAVSRGLVAMLAERTEQVEVVADHVDADVVLYDAHALADGDGADLERLVATSPAVIVAVRNGLRPALAAEAIARGAHGSVDLGSDRDALAESVVTAARRGRPAPDAPAERAFERLGEEVGLTPREVHVLALILQGLSNQEIADRSFLSINSVKTYIRSAYRRIGVSSRSQAVVWCLQHGFPTLVAA